MSAARTLPAEEASSEFLRLIDIHESIDTPLRRAIGVLDLIVTDPDSNDCAKLAADGAADWLRQAQHSVDELHTWWARNRDAMEK